MRETATSSHESDAGLKGLITIPVSESIFLSVSPVIVLGAAIAVVLGIGRAG